MVTFQDGNTVLTQAPVNSSGVVSFSTSGLASGNHTVTATYASDSKFAASSGSTVQVVQTGTTTAVSSSANPSVYSQPVTFTATVTANPPGGVPTGTVTFKNGGATLGTGTLNASGVATFTTSTLAVGAASITAVYGGGSGFNGSTSPVLTQTVNKAGTSTTVSSSAHPSVYSQPVTFTATVTATPPGSGVPTGTVTFKNGSTTLGTGTLNGSGVATFTTSTLAVGAASITAVYGGSSGFNASTSPVLTQTVNKAGTRSTVTSSVNPSAFNQSVTFTATVVPTAPATANVTGTVTFMDGSKNLHSSSLSSGHATYTVSNLSRGTHQITVVYAGSTNFLTSTSPVRVQTVQ
jgi:hypothetical protein